ncbi:bifunctional endoribonuclease/protein kinase ire1 [Lecanora helva]
MNRRHTAASTAVVSALTLSLLIFPLLAVCQQHERSESPQEQAALRNQYTGSRASRLNPDAKLDTTNYRYAKDTSVDEGGASAVATNPLAPAGEDRAVRAVQPARGSGKSAGLSTPLNARSLQDWEVEDFVLLATVDGSIHARDRKTGAARWELEVEAAMVETTYHSQNDSLLDQSKPEYEFLWIVEPSRDGDIYIYNQGGIGGLQKLHLTVKQLVADMSPYESVDPAVVYNAEKRTKLYTVDATTGVINKVFGSGSGDSLSKEPRCPKPGGLETLDDDECGSRGSFVLGRTEYTITIQNRDTTEPICTVKYSEWGPNARDGDLHSQYSSSMDNKYVYPLHDGGIFGWDYRQKIEKPSYIEKLSSPVVRVFDVARPLQSDDPDPQLIVLPQPIGPIDTSIYDTWSARNRIFVNHTENGGWFAMSENTYPLVTEWAKEAQCYKRDWQIKSAIHPLTLAERQEGFVGVHALSEFETRQGSGLTISAPDPQPVNDSPVDVYRQSAALPSIPVVGSSKIIGSAAANAYDIVILLVICVITTFFYINRGYLFKQLRQRMEIRPSPPYVQQTLDPVPSSPVAVTPSWPKEPLPTETEQVEITIENPDNKQIHKRTRTNSSLESPLTPPESQHSRSNSLQNQGPSEEQVPSEGKAVRIQEPAPGPEEVDDFGSPKLGKRKARRGKRGGAKRNKNRSDSAHQSREEPEKVIGEVPEKAVDLPVSPAIVRESSDISNVTGPIINIGHLSVDTEKVLGYGGHGTMVYKGTFGGRDVAVKRMLKEFYELASHEVGLLQESDDHPNVIRYFDKETAGQFLYIALELCPASLQDVIEKPSAHSALIPPSGLDMPNMLKQITSGVLYLHTLKIVHRDIKPQNILVSAPKLSLTNPSATAPPRLLISDFGLCKKLEGDQNSFRATTAFAAGTSGWRAPELLVDDDPNLPPRSALVELSGVDTTNNSEPLVVDSQTNRRATRAIDIFSLGCVFYYCLTQGSHPFDKDGKFMREANIVKGIYNLDALDCMGDFQWEAKDLIGEMLHKRPKERPDAAEILTHPFFWPPEDRLEFLCHVSDAFEHEKFEEDKRRREEMYYEISVPLTYLENSASTVLHEARGDFLRALPNEFKDTMAKQRKYKGDSVLDLLRALRNKKNHYEDMPESVKEKVGPLPAGYLGFWTRRFPSLLLVCWRIVGEVGFKEKDRFRRYYEG